MAHAARGPIHLRPAAELADRVLLPGDPHRALAVAQAVLDGPRMFNHRRGLWGYTGVAPDGRPLSVQATGMGGPSAAVVVRELLDLGARVMVRIGTCGALAEGLELGELIVAADVIPADGASAALGARDRILPSAPLTEALRAALDDAGGGRAGTIVSSDLFYDERPGMVEGWLRSGAIAVEMEAAAVLQLAASRGAAAGCLLAVSDLFHPEGPDDEPRRRIAQGRLEEAGIRLGEVAVAALAREGLGGPA